MPLRIGCPAQPISFCVEISKIGLKAAPGQSIGKCSFHRLQPLPPALAPPTCPNPSALASPTSTGSSHLPQTIIIALSHQHWPPQLSLLLMTMRIFRTSDIFFGHCLLGIMACNRTWKPLFFCYPKPPPQKEVGV